MNRGVLKALVCAPTAACAVLGLAAAPRGASDDDPRQAHFAFLTIGVLVQPFEEELRHDCGCVTGALSLVPPLIHYPDSHGPGEPARPSRLLKDAHDQNWFGRLEPDDVRAALSGRGRPDQQWMVARWLLSVPERAGMEPRAALPLAARLYRAAAQSGFERAEAELGYLYAVGWGVPHDDARAAYWFDRAARAGLPQAQLAVGAMHALGRGVARNESMALAWFGRARHLRLLGDAYACGLGVEKDLSRAKAFYERAAGEDTGDAALRLADMHAGAYGLRPDAAAPRFSRYVAGEEAGEAAVRLADMYARACGVRLDDEAAKRLYERAARIGNPEAQIALADLLLSPEPVQALSWALRAFLRLPNGALRDRAQDVRTRAAAMLPPEVQTGALHVAAVIEAESRPDPPPSRRR